MGQIIQAQLLAFGSGKLYTHFNLVRLLLSVDLCQAAIVSSAQLSSRLLGAQAQRLAI